MKRLSITIETQSNLFIGGTPATFEIGGIDQYTVVDFLGNPYVPGSSLKGVLRNIVRQLVKEKSASTEYLTRIMQEYCETLKQQLTPQSLKKIDDDRKKIILRNVDQLIESKPSAEHIFGIEGFNQTPKLLFSDLTMKKNTKNPIFSIDSKNSVDAKTLQATPRIYKTVAPNVGFQGEVIFQNCQQLADPDAFINASTELLTACFKLINQGYYRLGNSGSRGYGLVNITIGEHADERS
jgi:CRISPR-associated protein Csm3